MIFFSPYQSDIEIFLNCEMPLRSLLLWLSQFRHLAPVSKQQCDSMHVRSLRFWLRLVMEDGELVLVRSGTLCGFVCDLARDGGNYTNQCLRNQIRTHSMQHTHTPHQSIAQRAHMNEPKERKKKINPKNQNKQND